MDVSNFATRSRFILISIKWERVIWTKPIQKVWSLSEQKKLSVSLDSVFKYLCIYKGTTRPEDTLIIEKPLKSAG